MRFAHDLVNLQEGKPLHDPENFRAYAEAIRGMAITDLSADEITAEISRIVGVQDPLPRCGRGKTREVKRCIEEMAASNTSAGRGDPDASGPEAVCQAVVGCSLGRKRAA